MKKLGQCVMPPPSKTTHPHSIAWIEGDVLDWDALEDMPGMYIGAWCKKHERFENCRATDDGRHRLNMLGRVYQMRGKE